jgi:hypothetical protein
VQKASFSLSGPFYDDYVFAPGLFFKAGEQFRERASLDGLKHLGQLFGQGGPAVAEDFNCVGQKCSQAVGAFVEDKRVRRVFIDG